MGSCICHSRASGNPIFKARIFLVLILFFPLIAGCSAQIPYAEEDLLMDTFVRIQIVGNSVRDAKKRIVRNALGRMKELEKKFNYFSENSELAKINNLKAGDKLRVSPRMFEVLQLSEKAYRETGGAFDVTKGTGSWTLDRGERAVRFEKDGIKIDLGGIAKGFIVDQGIRVLQESGVTNALINAGGDMYCMGEGPAGKGWKIGIRNPKKPREVSEVLTIRDRAVATSGGYERFTEISGEKFSHIFDPQTGENVKDIYKSVTVVARDCATADALATALYVIEPAKALRLIEDINDADCVIIDESGLKRISSGFPKQP